VRQHIDRLLWQRRSRNSYGSSRYLVQRVGTTDRKFRSRSPKRSEESPYLIIDDSESDDVDEPSVNERNDELLGAIRTAGTMEFPLSSDGYDDLLRRGFIKGVTSVRIGQIFGSWRRACEIAGVEDRKRRGQVTSRDGPTMNWPRQSLGSSVPANTGARITDTTSGEGILGAMTTHHHRDFIEQARAGWKR